MPTKKKRVNIIPDNLPSLTEPEEVVPSLFTGNSLAEKDPERYGKIVQGLGEGRPLTRLARENKVAPETIVAISKREKKSIDSIQQLTQGLTTYATQSCLMRIIDKLEKDEIPAGVLPIAFGILRDKERADLGQASQIVEHKAKITLADVKAELEEMRRDAIDVTPKDPKDNQGV